LFIGVINDDVEGVNLTTGDEPEPVILLSAE